MLHRLPDFEVSREISGKLDHYYTLLLKWQKSINLVSPTTLSDAKKRHFEDSLQILGLIETTDVIYDIGSGAGFPGLVLANFAQIHLIESDQRKCQFLKTVSREADMPVIIHNGRVEDVDIEAPDIVTARALAPLNHLVEMTEKWWSKNKKLKFIFLKGRKAELEIEQAQQNFEFLVVRYSSRTDEDGIILVLTDVRRIR